MGKTTAAERSAAKKVGEIYYFTGRPCIHGHIAKRETNSGSCTACKHLRKNTETARLEQKRYAADNREKINKVSKKYRENNKYKINALTADRYASKTRSTPKWLTAEDKSRIRCYYSLAAMRNKNDDKRWDVDHIVPLRGDSVCGMHVPWNLQVIPRIENIKKGNRFVD